MIILIHSSKTMHNPAALPLANMMPALLPRACELAQYLASLSKEQVAIFTKASVDLAEKTSALYSTWTPQQNVQRPAIESFAGDIYSGMQISQWNLPDHKQANNQLRILSGLYGILRPYDGIYPYRLEMGYRLPDEPYKNLYKFWGSLVAEQLPDEGQIINLAAVEYSKLVVPYVQAERIITPTFLTISPKTGEPIFVVVHAKIARGALASWLVRNPGQNIEQFNEIGYTFDVALSRSQSPVFVCRQFKGLGLSVRLKHKN